MRDLNNSFYNYATDSEVKKFQSFWVEIDRKEQQMFQKIYINFHGYIQEKVGSTYNLAVRSLGSMSFVKTRSRNPIL